jgi:hypothetical protein
MVKTVIRILAALIGLMWVTLGLISLFVDDPIFEPKFHAAIITLLGAYCLACGVAGRNLYRHRKL